MHHLPYMILYKQEWPHWVSTDTLEGVYGSIDTPFSFKRISFSVPRRISESPLNITFHTTVAILSSETHLKCFVDPTGMGFSILMLTEDPGHSSWQRSFLLIASKNRQSTFVYIRWKIPCGYARSVISSLLPGVSEWSSAVTLYLIYSVAEYASLCSCVLII